MDTTSEHNPAKEDAAPEATVKNNHNRALFISGMVMAALFGILIGMFAASDKANSNAAAVKTPETSEKWLDEKPDSTETLASVPSGEQGNAPGDEPPSPIPEEPSADTGSENVHRGKVKSGVPVIKSLSSLGISAGESQLIINALEGIFDFRKARPGHEFEVKFTSTSDKISSFRYQASKTEIYVVKREGNDYKGRRLVVETDKETRVFAGTITTSLFGTMKDLGAKPSLAGKVADILSNQLDFLKEQRPGDTFRVMVEEESLDEEFLGYGPVLALEYNGTKAGQRRLFRFQEGNSNVTYFDDKMVSIPRSALTIPLYYSRMSSPFGYRIHPVLKIKKLHTGTDFSAPPGTPVWACAEGEVIHAGPKGANGNLVGIKHENGISSYYAHLQKIEPGIKPGVKVRRKQVIGYVGSTGRSTGPHLHWGIKQNGKFIDPLKYKVIPGKKIAAKYRGELKSVIEKLGAVLSKTKIEPPKGELAVVPEGDEPLSDY